MWALLKGIDLKWVAITVGVIAAFLVGWKLYDIVLDNGIKDGIIQTQKSTIENQSLIIKNMEAINALANVIIRDRDSKLSQLETQMNGLTDDLGEGQDDLAPPSIRNFLERLKK